MILCLSALRMEKFWFSRRRRRRRFVSSKAVSDDARSNVEKKSLKLFEFNVVAS